MNLTRRHFLTRLAAAATVPGMTRLSFAQSAENPAGNAEAHTLICVFLRGGADTLNVWVPYADDNYYRQRPTLSIKAPGADADRSIKLTDRYALHPMMKPLEAAFKEGRLGAVQSVAVQNTSGSHFECQDQMEHGDADQDQSVGGGWLGRFLRGRLGNVQASPLGAVALGTVLPEALRGAPSVSVMQKLEDLSLKMQKADPAPVMAALQALYTQDSGQLGGQGRETIDLFRRVAELRDLAAAPENGAVYPKDMFGDQLYEVARLIKARVGLQVACVDLGNWDTHFFQGTTAGLQADRIKLLAEGIGALDTDLKSQRANYTVMITTEFGRRTYENASLGTDHGRGYTFMALGDRVQGGQVLGAWPITAMDESNPLGPGGVQMETEYRRVFAEMLRGTFKATDAELAQIFPGGSLKPVGIMKA